MPNWFDLFQKIESKQIALAVPVMDWSITDGFEINSEGDWQINKGYGYIDIFENYANPGDYCYAAMKKLTTRYNGIYGKMLYARLDFFPLRKSKMFLGFGIFMDSFPSDKARGYGLYVDGSRVYFEALDPSTMEFSLSDLKSITNLSDDEKYHFRECISPDGELKIYINEELEKEYMLSEMDIDFLNSVDVSPIFYIEQPSGIGSNESSGLGITNAMFILLK